MSIVDQVLTLAHLVGFAGLLGGCLAQVQVHAPEVSLAMLWGAWLQVVTLVGLAVLEVLGPEPNYLRLAVRLFLALVALLLVAKNRKFADIPRGLLGLIGVLAVADAAIAVLWT